jgi:hypothetical protein
MIGTLGQMKDCAQFHEKQGDKVRSQAIKRFLSIKTHRVEPIPEDEQKIASSAMIWRREVQKANSSPVYDPVKGKLVVRSQRIEVNYTNHQRHASQPIVGRYKNGGSSRRRLAKQPTGASPYFKVTFN